MGQIREDFILTDQFSGTFSRFLQLGQAANSGLDKLGASSHNFADSSAFAAQQLDAMRSGLAAQQSLYAAQNQRLEAQRQKVQELQQSYDLLIQSKGAEASATIRAAEALARAQISETNLLKQASRTADMIARQNEEIERFPNKMDAARAATRDAAREQEKHKRKVEETANSANKLLSALKRVAAVTGVMAGIKSFLDLSDTQTQTNARLSMMVNDLEDMARLQEGIFQSAQRARASYEDTADSIAKMALNAGQAFNSNDEIIRFMESINKRFAIGGTAADQQRSAMLQLTQAMGAGVLRGEELNSILDAAPGIARDIEQYMGWASGSIKQYAEDGKVSAEVVKNAMLSAAETIDEQFASMPMTLGQAMTLVKNEVQNSLQDSAKEWNDFMNSADGQKILNEMIVLFSTLAEVGSDVLAFLGQGALFVADNLDFILPVLAAIGLAYGVVHAQAIAAAVANVAGGLATAAAWAAAHWPLLLLAAGFAAVMIAAQQFGLDMQSVGEWVGMTFGMLYAVGYNVFASLWNTIAAFAEFFANVWDDPLGATVRLFFDVFDSILGIVETTAGAIDALLGTNLSSAVAGFREELSGWVKDTFGENAVKIERMTNLDVRQTSEQWGQYGGNLGAKLDDMNLNLSDIAESMSGFDASSLPTAGELGDIGKVGSVGSVKNVEGEVKLSDEDVKLYRDLAESRYMNRIELKTLAPNINVSIPESAAGSLSAEDVADRIRVMLIEEAASQTAISHG